MNKISIEAGESFEILLYENTSTGYSWSYVTDEQGLHLASEYIKIPKADNEPLVGMGHEKVFRFKAMNPGTYLLTFTYSQPWDQGQKAAETKIYTVKVVK
ncbi:protease inhibitor I42 family protein [Paenibacillus sinopodophylli]|uniref:protease inhibitor I42 family protein n=1 Tax=Paenibacillus sinopodophylli TaxID=1837342 RepID=UPI00110CDA36|nr:protease inhibitor I42 family protein [Paenibacillus sinopodophylli]